MTAPLSDTERQDKLGHLARLRVAYHQTFSEQDALSKGVNLLKDNIASLTEQIARDEASLRNSACDSSFRSSDLVELAKKIALDRQGREVLSETKRALAHKELLMERQSSEQFDEIDRLAAELGVEAEVSQ